MFKPQHLFFLFILLLSQPVFAQNTLDGEEKIVPEKEVERQSKFIAAEQQRLLGEPNKAVDLYKEFLYENPDNGTAWYGLARAQAEVEAYGDALESITKAVAKEPANEWYLIFQADLLEKMAKVPDAVGVYTQLVEQQPENTAFYEQLAYLQVLAGDPKSALKTLNKLESFMGITEEVISKKHVIYLGMDDKKKAAAEIRRLIDAYPAKIEFRHRLATFYEADGDTEEAQKVYAEILEVNPNDPVAQLAVKKKEKGSSEAQFLESLKPQFQNSTVSIDAKVKELAPYLNVFSETGKEDIKSALFELADLMQNAHSSDPKAWSLAGDIYYLAGKNQEAYIRYQRCIQLSPNVFSVWENSLRILYEDRDFETLYNEAEKAMDAFPNQAIGYYFFAQGAIGTDRSREAIPVLNQAIIMSGRNPGLQLDIEALLIHAYNLSGQGEAALKQSDKALSHGGDKHPIVLEYTGDAYFNANNKSKAREYWEKAKAIQSTPELNRKLAENKI